MKWLWFLMALFAATASGQRLTTFSWDANANWPPGTTVELCSNGDVCLSGITGTQATLDLPVQPGEVIQGQVRAVAPAGYQCGNPPAPCPYSEWATVAQTWPSSGIGLWAHKQQETQMAISRTGSIVTINSGTTGNTGSTSITVPADAQIAILGLAGYYDSVNYFSGGSITIGGNTLTEIANDSSITYFQGELAYLVNPPTGTQTLAWDWSGTSAPLDAPAMIIAFYKGNDTSNPIGSQYAGQNSSASFSTESLTAQSGDFIIAIASMYQQYPSSWTNATRISQINSGNSHLDFAENSSVSGNTTVSFAITSTDGGIAALVLKPAAAGGATALPRRALDGPFYGSLRGSVR